MGPTQKAIVIDQREHLKQTLKNKTAGPRLLNLRDIDTYILQSLKLTYF